MLLSMEMVADFSAGCALPIIAHAFLLTPATSHFAN
jgi:hypothetical protein